MSAGDPTSDGADAGAPGGSAHDESPCGAGHPTGNGSENGSAGPRRRWIRRHAVLCVGTIAVLGVGAVFTWSQVRPLMSSEYRNIDYVAPVAPQLSPGADETLYRIDPTLSVATYEVDETFVGSDPTRTTGSTNGLAGDFAVNTADPSGTRVGDIVVNLEQLRSDDALRDTRLRSAYLESYSFPLATFRNGGLVGAPEEFAEGMEYEFSMTGDLEIKTTTLPTRWNVVAIVDQGRLTATATTVITMSDYEIGPISLAGLLRTGDEITLELRLVALDPTRESISTEITVPPEPEAVENAPSFRNEVMPVLAANCASCHNSNTMGSHHWTLDDAGDASDYSHAIGVVTAAGYMPPWPASDVGVPLSHSAELQADTISMLSEWADAGGPLDVPAATPIRPPADSDEVTVRPDLTLEMPEPYTGSQAVPDDYRCFALDPGFTEPTFMTGYEFLPDQIEQIHHAQVFRVRAGVRSQIDGRSGADGRPGYSCFVGPEVGPVVTAEGRSAGSDLVGGWAPGRNRVASEDIGQLFQPGDVLVLQVHYHYDQPAVPDQSTFVMQTALGTEPIREVEVVNPLAPVEIPCSPGVVAVLCDRDAAIADNVRLYGPPGSFIESGLLGACGTTPEQLTASYATTGIAASSCISRVPSDGQIVSVLGHMHTLGRSFRMTLDPGTPQEKVLLDIPDWDFDWQMLYGLETPVEVVRGQTVKIECTWDRSMDPKRPPKYIVFAEGTEDEMCFSTYSLVPKVAAPTVP